MQNSEIIIRTEDAENAALIAGAISNTLEHHGFTNVNVDVDGYNEFTDPELAQLFAHLNPEFKEEAIDITFEKVNFSGAVDAAESGIEESEEEEN